MLATTRRPAVFLLSRTALPLLSLFASSRVQASNFHSMACSASENIAHLNQPDAIAIDQVTKSQLILWSK